MLSLAIKKRLKSETGASLMLALLFFVLCAVCASVIITAATAASAGVRLAARADSAYYSSSSAARYLNGVFEKTELVLRESRKKTVKTTVRTRIESISREDGSTEEIRVSEEESEISYKYTCPYILPLTASDSLQKEFLTNELVMPLYQRQLAAVYDGNMEGELSYESISAISGGEIAVDEEQYERLWNTSLGDVALRGIPEKKISIRLFRDGSADRELSSTALIAAQNDGSLSISKIKSDAEENTEEGISPYTLSISIPSGVSVERRIKNETSRDDLSGINDEEEVGTRVSITVTEEEKLTRIGWGTGYIRKGG